MRERILDFLLENANPSIRLRVKKEVLRDIGPGEEAALLEKVLLDRHVVTAVSSQRPDGWIGEYFHGSADLFGNMEVGLRFLAEKGLPAEHPVIARAVTALANTPKSDSAYGLRRPLDSPEEDYAYTGAGIYLPRSSIALRAGYEKISPQNGLLGLPFDVDFSLRSFLSVCDVQSPEEIIETRRGKLCFKKGVMWPCIYHLRMLAFSEGWRAGDNMDRLSRAISHLYRFPYTGFVYTLVRSQLKGPCMPFVHSGPVNESLENGAVGGMYFDRLELLARCGALTRVDPLKKEYDMLMNSLDEHGLFDRQVIHKYALGWSPYFGFALEEDWKSKTRKQCDILFRILLIMTYRERTM